MSTYDETSLRRHQTAAIPSRAEHSRSDRTVQGPQRPPHSNTPPLPTYAPERADSLPAPPVAESQPYHPHTSSRVIINVGGKKFETTRGTLSKRPNTYLGKLFPISRHLPTNNRHDSDTASISSTSDIPPNGEHIFIDRNPDLFSVILELYRTNILVIPAITPRIVLDRELKFYGIAPVDPQNPTDITPTDGGPPITIEYADAYNSNP
ncbi:hypothetical protein HK097_011608, partial [Rhizophlyctis rosea]